MLFRLATWIAIIPIGWLTVLFWRISVRRGPGQPARRPARCPRWWPAHDPCGRARRHRRQRLRASRHRPDRPAVQHVDEPRLRAGRRSGSSPRRRRWGLDPSAVVFGALVAANGLGSMAYHAAVDASGRWLHDLSLLGALGFVAGWQVAKLRPEGPAAPGAGQRSPPARARGHGRGPRPGARRHGRLPGRARRRRPASPSWSSASGTRARPAWSDLPFVLVAVFAVGAFFLGRTGSPACHPDAVFQWHGVWHVATAVLAVVWAFAALSLRARGRGRGPGRARPLARGGRRGRGRRVLPRGHGRGP